MDASRRIPDGPVSASPAVEARTSTNVPERQSGGAGDLNLRVLWPLARWVSDRHGKAALGTVAAAGGLQPAEIDGTSRWVSVEQFEGILSAAYGYARDEQEFKDACGYRLPDGLGPFRYLVWAISPRQVYQRAESTTNVVSRVSRYKILSSTRTVMRAQYTSDVTESRLMCLSRQGQAAALPTIWGLPPAFITESKCLARGDDCCEYVFRLFDKREWWPSVVGFGIGVVGAFVVASAGVDHIASAAAIPLAGLLAGYSFEQSRTNRANTRVGEEIALALQELAKEDAEARREILKLTQRQREWTRLMEEQVADRTQALQAIVDKLQTLGTDRASSIQGVSRSLVPPFQALREAHESLRARSTALGEDGTRLVAGWGQAIGQMQSMLDELSSLAGGDSRFVEIVPQMVEVPRVVDGLRRRLRALVHGRPIRVSVFSTREAPELFETDMVVLDRITDNVLTNAAKFTERGSIVVEVTGGPGIMTLKISDSGPGMTNDALESVFASSDSSPPTRGARGMLGVVRLLNQLGGRLEIMSKPGVGTTVWVHFPVRLPSVPAPPLEEIDRDPDDSIVERVVRIRRNVA